MKKKLKQVFAVVMAVAMVLSLSVTAFATNERGVIDATDGAAFVDHIGTNSGDVMSGDNFPASGGIKAESRSEGPMPEDPVEVIFPTVPANPQRGDGITSRSADSFSVFDIILDPHSLITKTNAARYTRSGGTAKEFDKDTRLYFLTTLSGDKGQQVYSGKSYPLTITNKSRQPVSVNLSLNVTHSGDYITLVSGKDGLKMVSGDAMTSPVGAQMYFALKANEDTVLPAAMYTGGEKPFITVSGKGNYLEARTASGDSVNFNWDNSVRSGDKPAIADKLAEIAITLSYVAPATVTSGGELQKGEITLSGDPQTSGYTISGGRTITSGGTYTLSVKSGNDTVATVDLKVKAPNPHTMKQDATGKYAQTIQFKKRTTGAIFETAIAGNEDLYVERWVDPDSVTGTATAPQGMTERGYYWDFTDKCKADMQTKKAEDMFPTLTFNLEGDINNDNTWDLWPLGEVTDENEQVSFTLIWDVMQKSTYYDNIEAVGGSKLPSVTVNTKATTSQNLVLNYTPGTGDYEGYGTPTQLKVGSKTLTLSYNANAGTLTVSGSTSSNYSSLVSATTEGSITFKGTGLTDYVVKLTGMRA